MSRESEEAELLSAAMGAMGAKLRMARNRGKSPWRDESVPWLLERLEEEVVELQRAVGDYAVGSGAPSSVEAVIGEAADVMNFAAMIVDSLTHEHDLPRLSTGQRWAERLRVYEGRIEKAVLALRGL
jgi:NTP pyrophosphatase (non-canonical NTP hydrolase)